MHATRVGGLVKAVALVVTALAVVLLARRWRSRVVVTDSAVTVANVVRTQVIPRAAVTGMTVRAGAGGTGIALHIDRADGRPVHTAAVEGGRGSQDVFRASRRLADAVGVPLTVEADAAPPS